MRRNMFLVIEFLLGYFCLTSATSAPFITKCKLTDQKCLKDTAQKTIPIIAAGVPNLGVDALDPVFIKHIDASSSNLKLTFSNAAVTGLKGCVVKKIKPDIEKSKMFVKLMCTVDLKGTYTMSGRLLIVPIEGNGDVHVLLRKAIFGVDCTTEEIDGKDGKKHWHVKSWDYAYDLKDKADVEFSNLFNGNAILGQAAKELITNNGNDVVLEIGGPVIKSIITKVIDAINEFYNSVPLDDLVIED